MTVRVFIEPGQAEPGRELELDDEESRYLLRVRRGRVGMNIELLDGEGGAWTAEVASAGRRARVLVGPPRARSASAQAKTKPRILLLGLPDNAATLESVTGASELGATQIVFVRCERSQGRCPSRPRLQRVMRAAMRQCGRPSPPTLLGGPPEPAWSLDRALDHEADFPGLFGAPGGPAHLGAHDGGVRLLVGPEGGLTPTEIEAVKSAGFTAVGLGPWTLRTPTAAIALLALLAG